MNDKEMEYSALLEEYKALKSEIAANLASSRQTTHLTIVALGLLAGSAKLLSDSGTYWILLFGPPVFFALILSQLRYTYLALDMGAYINDRIAHRMRLLTDSQVMGWEAHSSNLFEGLRMLPVRSATLLIPWLGAVGSMTLYCIFHFSPGATVINQGWWVGTILVGAEFVAVIVGTLYCYQTGLHAERLRNTRREPGVVQLESPEIG